MDKESREELKYYFGGNTLSKMEELEREARENNGYVKIPSSYFSSSTGVTSPYYTTFRSAYLGIYNPDTIPFKTYKQMEMDAQISAALSVVQFTMMNFRLIVECPSREIKQFIEAKIIGPGQIYWHRLLGKILQAQAFGIFIGEKIYQRPQEDPDGHILIRKLKDLEPSPDFLEIYITKDREYAGVSYRSNLSGERVFLPADRTFRYTRGERWGYLWGIPRDKPAYTPWYNYTLVDIFAARYMERKATRPWKAFAEPGKILDESGSERDGIELMVEVLKKLRDHDAAVIPYVESRTGKRMFDIEEIQDSSSIGSTDAFVEYLRFQDIKKTRGVLGPDRFGFQDPGTGSKASAEVYAELGLALTFGEFESFIVAEWTNHYVKPLVVYNFGKNHDPFSIIAERPDTLHQEFLRELYRDAVRAGLAFPDLNKLASQLGVPVESSKGDGGEEDEDETEREKKQREVLEEANRRASRSSISYSL